MSLFISLLYLLIKKIPIRKKKNLLGLQELYGCPHTCCWNKNHGNLFLILQKSKSEMIFFFLLYYIFLNLIKVLQLYILNIKLWHFSRWKMEFDVTYTKNKILNFGQCSGSSSLFISTWYKILPVFLCLSGILVTLKGCAVLDEWLWRKDHLYRSLD